MHFVRSDTCDATEVKGNEHVATITYRLHSPGWSKFGKKTHDHRGFCLAASIDITALIDKGHSTTMGLVQI